MKEYKVTLETEANLKASDGTDTSELGIALQVYQDLNRLSSRGFLNIEDMLIKKILEQVLEIEFNSVEEIPVPDYYEERKDTQEDG